MRNQKLLSVSFFIFLFAILSLSLISAQPPFQQSENVNKGVQVRFTAIPFVEINQTTHFHFHAFNSTNGDFLFNDTTQCSFHLYGQEGTHLYKNENLDFDNPYDWEVTIEGGNFSSTGYYSYIAQCNNTDGGGFVAVDFQVIEEGASSSLTDYRNLIFLYFFIAILAFVFLFLGHKTDWIIFPILSGILLLLIGISLMINPIPNLDNFIMRPIALVLIGIGLFFIIVSGWGSLDVGALFGTRED